MVLFLHLPLKMGITIVGASVLNIIEHAGEHLPDEVKWQLTFALVVIQMSIAALVQIIQSSAEHQRMHHVGSRALLISAILITLFGFIELSENLVLVILNALIFVPILAGFIAWLQTIENMSRDVKRVE
jgi:hypothetical protein